MGFIDADTHVLECDQTWSCMDPSERAFTPVAIQTSDPEPKRLWMVGDQRFTRGGAFTGTSVENVGMGARDLTDVPSRVAWMDRLGVELQMVFPSLFLMAVVRRPEVEAALARSYNRWMAERWEESGKRLRWAVVPALDDLEFTAEQLRFGSRHGACAVLLRGAEKDRSLVDPYLFPLYSCLQDLNMAAAVHVGNINPGLNALSGSGAMMYNTVPVIAAFYSLLASDLPERFPLLRWGFLEAAASWIAFALQQASRGAPSGRRVSRSFGGKTLEERRFYVACMVDEDLPYLLRYAGLNSLVLGTDFGHTDIGTDLEAHRLLTERTDVDKEVLRRIADDNARALYALSPAAVAPVGTA